LQSIKPYRELIFGILLIGLFVSSVYAFQFKNGQRENQAKLNPRTSSTYLKHPDQRKKNPAQRKVGKRPTVKSKETRKTVKKIKYPQSSQRLVAEERRVKKNQADLIISDGPGRGSYQIEFQPGINGLEIMKIAQRDYGLSFQYQTYPGLGAYITSIGGLQKDRHRHYYWALYYNNQMSTVGISLLYPKNNSTISWQYSYYQ